MMASSQAWQPSLRSSSTIRLARARTAETNELLSASLGQSLQTLTPLHTSDVSERIHH
jgi:hypothetical protein